MREHTRARLAERLNATDAAEAEAIIAGTLSALARQGVRDAAVRIMRAAGKVRTTDGSNGETLVLLVRNGQDATVMWRRLSQAHTREAYGVARVLCRKGTCEASEHRAHA